MARKKVTNKSAFLQLQRAKKAHRLICDASLMKSERDPITREINAMITYLDKLAYDEEAFVVINTPEENMEANTSSMSNQVLLEEHQEIIQEMTIKGFAWPDIRKAIYDQSKQMVHPKSLQSVIKAFKETEAFAKRNAEFMDSTKDMRLFTKAGRMEELTVIYRDMLEQYNRRKTRETVSLLMRILDQARKESDVAVNYNFQMIQNNMQINGSVNFNMLERDVEKNALRNMPLHEILIGRIARKMNVSPIIMLRRLQNSYYSAQAGMIGLDHINDKISYPSEILYDVEDMVARQEAIQIEEAKIIVDPDDPQEEPSEIKKRILDRLASKKSNNKSNE